MTRLESKDYSSRIKVPSHVKARHQAARDALEKYITVDEDAFHSGEHSGHEKAISKVVRLLEAWQELKVAIPQHIIDDIERLKIND